jgi:hypothetical protein
MAARRRAAARGGLIGPLALLAGGAVAGVGFWWLLMLDPAPAPASRVRAAAEQLTSHDQAALDRLLDRPRP